MAGLGQRARLAMAWNVGFTVFRDLLQFGTMLLLTRMLLPEDYGRFGLTNGVIGFLSILSISNFVAYTLQVRSDSETHYQQHFTAGAVLQISLFAVANFVALMVRAIPAYASVALLVHVVSVTFLLEWPSQLRIRMLQRELDWKRLRTLHGIGLAAGAALAIALAGAGAGVYALVVPGMLTALPFVVDLFLLQKWRPDWSLSLADYRPALQFGLSRIGSGLLGGARQLLESGAITAAVGFTAMGLFSRSIGFATMFCLRLATQLMEALYPVLTRVEGDGEAARANALVLRLVMWTATPIAVTFAALASPAIRLVYGNRWDAVIPLLPWAMAWGALAAGGHAAYMLLLARGHTRLCLIHDLGYLGSIALALWVALPEGLAPYLMAIVVAQGLFLGFLVGSLVWVGAAAPWGVVAAFLPPLFCSGTIWGALEFTRTLGGVARPDALLPALAWGAMFGVLYLFLLRVVFSSQLRELIAPFPASKSLMGFLMLRAPR